MRSCLVTGASTGIGEACVRRLDGAGWTVFAGVRRDADAARLRSALSNRLRTIVLDVTDPAAIAATAAAVTRDTGEAGLDALVNNAGIAMAAPLEAIPLQRFRQQLEVNVVGALAVTQAFLPLVRRARGRIVLMGSIGGRMATPFLGPYCASKFALEAMADSLRVELQPWNIDVILLEPGSIATPIWNKGAATAAELTAEIPAAVRELYADASASVQRMAASTGARGLPADDVADVVERVLTIRRPKPRYLVGADARQRARLGGLVPDRLRDAILTRVMGLPRRGAFVSGRS
jgi:NAD(P)-dependent dehydrogenase (short-subunit alcohol dehydrogenase family)